MSTLSIVVICYNQEDMILECLDSILKSDTKDVELIISDDHSEDNSIRYARSWVKKHRERFDNVIINVLERHSGTVKNVVHGVNLTKSGIIKLIAADDLFLPQAIDEIKWFSQKHEGQFEVVFSPLKVLSPKGGGLYEIGTEITPAYTGSGVFFSLNIKEQFIKLSRHNYLRAPGAFFTRYFWEKIKLELIPVTIMEDWAMWLQGLARESRYIQMNKPIVAYRKNMLSVSNNATGDLFKIYLRDHIITLRYVVFSRKDWLSSLTYAKMNIFCIILWCVSHLPSFFIRYLNDFRKMKWNCIK